MPGRHLAGLCSPRLGRGRPQARKATAGPKRCAPARSVRAVQGLFGIFIAAISTLGIAAAFVVQVKKPKVE